jgi:hypothetical protein
MVYRKVITKILYFAISKAVERSNLEMPLKSVKERNERRKEKEKIINNAERGSKRIKKYLVCYIRIQ